MADLYSPAVVGRARAISDASEAEAHMQARLQALMIEARMQRDIARLTGDATREADYQRNVDWLAGALADHVARVYRQRVAGEKLVATTSTPDGRSLDDQLCDEATALAAQEHRAELAAEAVDADDAEAHRLDTIDARIRRIERDDRAERLALQALTVAEARR